MAIAASGLVVALTLNPPSLGADKWQDLELEVTFTQRNNESLAIYPGAALPAQRSGWGGPTFDVQLRPEAGGPSLTTREVRSRYGPPGQPPAEAYYKPHRILLQRGVSHRHAVHACWLPRASLSAKQLDARTLDPDGMDELDPKLLQVASALVIGETCAALAPRASDPELLRGSVIVFIPCGGRYRVTFSYAQDAWTVFDPGAAVQAESPPAALAIAP